MAIAFVGFAAKLREHQGFLAVTGELDLAEVDMAAIHIGVMAAEPAGGRIDETGIVQLFEDVVDIVAVELAPALIENRPVANAGMVLQLIYRCCHAIEEHFAGRGVAVHLAVVQFLDAHSRKCRVTEEAVVAVVDHVLENDHAQLVTLVVEFFWLYLDMLAQCIETQALHGQDIVSEALRFGGSEDAVGPVALIQQAMEEVRLAVEAQTGVVPYFLDFQRANGEVGLHLILFRFNCEIVKIGVFRTPKVGIFRGDGNAAVVECKFAQFGNDDLTFHLRLGGNGNSVAPVFDVQLADISFRDTLQPHSLPDAGNRRVPHAAAIEGLFSVGVVLIVQIVKTAEANFIFLFQHMGDIKGHAFIAACVVSHLFIVDKAFQILICCTNVKQNSATIKSVRQKKATAIEQSNAVRIMHLQPGELGFRAEGQLNGLVVFSGELSLVYLKFPLAIQIQNAVPPHLGTGVNIPRSFVGGKEFLSPLG